ncbi:D-glycero-beta-D-manno-heptose 1,7-bisphosphate 7-phosphatase [uncultured Gimesia sp.]|uniref:D-glycero-beta-D-manno-heptose 1,7-bisphosphate 7-phosphatase n=1 Tax=uncultured Gimesia sp. TaxID=1678688 RepID=UPI0030DCFEEB|tara:strand:+ start:153834 stop:154418 length:585 start_codon:yes stop_codon:yes gene_type:complete
MQAKSSPKKSLFLDRDGVINKEKHYLYRIEDFEFVDGIFALCQTAVDNGYGLIVITNQAGIARGYYTEQQFLELTEWMKQEFARRNLPLTDLYYCPHHPRYGGEQYCQQCECRKPGPGMLLDAAQKHDLDLSASILVGDKGSDIAAGRAAGIGTTALVGTGHPVSAQDRQTADLYSESLPELKETLFPATITGG